MRWLAVLLGLFLALSPTLEAIPTRDAAGRVSQTKNGLNKTTQFFYDTAGRLSYTLDPLSRRIDKTFDEAGRQLTLKNRLSKTFSHAYGSDGLPAAFTFPSGRQSTIVDRDAAGRPKTLQSPGGQQAVLTYEVMGRIKTQADAVGTITWTYDNEGNPTNIAQGSANIARAYDNVGRMLSCTDASGNTVSYTYDSEGNTAKITYPGNKTVTYTYDGSNRLKTVTDWASRLTTYTYDTAGRLTQVDRPNGTRQRLQYDNADRLTASFEEKGATSLWQAGYGYDDAYRLTSYTPTPITKTLPPPPATMTYDTDNRLATYNGQAVSSDANGNLLAAPVAGTLLGALTWDARNRLSSAGGVSYAYDAENRRISSTQSGQTTTYTWSRGAALDRLLVKNNPDGSVTRYIYGLGLIYEETTPASGAATTSFYHYNWQGSTMALSDASGNVTARLAYSPYGERTVVSGTVTTPFCFNGQFGVMTEPNGLLAMQARYYAPIFRRFLSEDPSGFSGGINLYAYTGGDPVNFMDPFGLGPMTSAGKYLGLVASTGPSPQQQFVDSFLSGNVMGMAASGLQGFVQSALVSAVTLAVPGSVARVAPVVTAAKTLPEVRFSAGRYPELAENISHAQRAGHPSVLTHAGNSAANRAAALDGVPNIRPLSRDEYPFASSLEGGAGSWIGHVPVSQQNAQGAILKNFFKQNKIQPGDQYRVIVDP